MTEPLSYRLLESIAARLALVLTANGYRTDLGETVRIDPAFVDPQQVGPVTYVVAGDFARRAESSTQRQQSSECEIIIEAILPISRDNATLIAHRCRADFLRALFDTAVDLPKDTDGSAATGHHRNAPRRRPRSRRPDHRVGWAD